MRLFAINWVLFTVGLFMLTDDPTRSMAVATMCAGLSWVGYMIHRSVRTNPLD